MFLDEISIQTSILIYAGLGFLFLIGFVYYFYHNRIKNHQSGFFRVILGCVRGLILASLLVAILPFKFFDNSKFKEPIEFIFVVDFPEITDKKFEFTFKKVDSILKIKHPNLEWIDFKGVPVVDFKRPPSISRSLNHLNQTIRKLNKAHKNIEIFILTDGNLNDLDIEWAVKTHLIPFGEVVNHELIEFSAPRSPIFSVPDEEVHLPIDVWLKNFKKNKIALMEIYIDGLLYKKQRILFDNDHTYLTTDVSLKSNRLGNHKIKVTLGNGIYSFIDWNVVNEKAVVYGFSDALDPDVGVLNRVAKNKFVKLVWVFDPNAKTSKDADKFIFLRILSNDVFKRKITNGKALFLNIAKDKGDPNLLNRWSGRQRTIEYGSLWDSQMKAFQSQGSYAQTDSIIGLWFDDLFIQSDLIIDSLTRNRSNLDVQLAKGLSSTGLGRNMPKLNFLNLNHKMDLLELEDLSSVNFLQVASSDSDKVQESKFLWQNIYFKLGIILLVLVEWIIRKFKELR